MAEPVAVGDLEERLRLEDAGIVDENIDRAQLPHQAIDLGGAADIAGDAGYRGFRLARDALHRFVDLSLAAPVDDHRGAFTCETLGNGETDALRGAGDKRALAAELEIHGQPPLLPSD